MKKISLLTAAVIAALPVMTGTAMAAGFQSTTHSAAGVGRANAGEAVIADSAAVLGRNPAAMTRFDEPTLSVGLNMVMPDTHVTNISLGVVPVEDQKDVTSNTPAPNIYYIHPVNDRLAFGVAAFSNFATGTEFSDDFNNTVGGVPTPDGGFVPIPGGVVGGTTKVTTVNLNASVAYKVIDQLSLGLGVNAIYGEGEFARPVNVPNGTGGTTDVGLAFKGDNWAFAWDLGAMYEINENHRFGLSYRSGVDFTAKGDGTFMGQSFNETKLALPSISEFSGFHQVSNAWAVHYSIQWTGWSAFDKVEFGDVTENVYGWEDSLRYAVGTTWTISDSWTARAGLAFDETPVPEENRTMSIPDSNRIWYSIGATWNITKKDGLDFGFTYLQGEKLDAVELGGLVTSQTETNAIIAGINYNRKF